MRVAKVTRQVSGEISWAPVSIRNFHACCGQMRKPRDTMPSLRSAPWWMRALSWLGAVFAIFAGFYYWIPKMSGYRYNGFLGGLHFWLMFVGVNIVFFPQHFLGLQGMPRRYIDYPEAFEYCRNCWMAKI